MSNYDIKDIQPGRRRPPPYGLGGTRNARPSFDPRALQEGEAAQGTAPFLLVCM